MGNGSSRKGFLGPGKRKQEKKLPGILETEAAEKVTWDLGNGSSRKSFLGIDQTEAPEKSFPGPGKRRQQKKLPETWETEAAEKASWDLTKRKQQKKSFPGPGKRRQQKKISGTWETTDWEKEKTRKTINDDSRRSAFLFFIYNVQGNFLRIFYTYKQAVYYREILSRWILIFQNL